MHRWQVHAEQRVIFGPEAASPTAFKAVEPSWSLLEDVNDVYLTWPASEKCFMPWKGHASAVTDHAAVMTETRRILGSGHYKVEETKVKLDRSRLRGAPHRCIRLGDLPIMIIRAEKPTTPCRVRLLQCDALEAAEALSLEHESQPLVLDFASGSNPGGGAKSNQQGTQEEDMCRRSSLLATLEQQEYPLPTGGLYAPDVCVFRGPGVSGYPLIAKPFWVSVLACEMPNCGDMGPKERAFVAQKIRQVLHVALQQGHSAVVLGAWGCGAFGNDPKIMASVFKARTH